MSIQALRDRLPDYARDLRLNLGNLAAESVLGESQKAGAFIASAVASRKPHELINILKESKP